jgi:predicted DCC family thiol-disulfide oxidoreductase YuxK
MSEIIVLTDGQCRFCEASMAWVAKKVAVNPIAYQEADLSQYGLTYEQCSKAVHAAPKN